MAACVGDAPSRFAIAARHPLDCFIMPVVQRPMASGASGPTAMQDTKPRSGVSSTWEDLYPMTTAGVSVRVCECRCAGKGEEECVFARS